MSHAALARPMEIGFNNDRIANNPAEIKILQQLSGQPAQRFLLTPNLGRLVKIELERCFGGWFDSED
jgi:hypothetical protein